ncbi:MAG: CHASE2 domain-containing protein, partial [Vulcanimicrobiota bacterium]
MNKIGHKGLVIFISLALGLLFYIFFTAIWPQGELFLYDWRLGLLRDRTMNPRIQVVTIDQESLDTYGAWPWPRTVQAEFINRLNEFPPKIIFFDFIFDDPKPGDQAFAQAMKKANFDIVLASRNSKPDAIGVREYAPP